jgi:peroxiredoxin
MRTVGVGKIPFILVLMVLLAFPGTGTLSAQNTAMRVQIGERAPDFSLKDVTTGKVYNLSEYKGKQVVMLEFWATWCDICKREMPHLVDLYSEWKPKGFELLSIVLPSGNIDDIRKIIREKKLNYPTLLDADLSVATKAYGLAGPIPLKVIIDHKGIVRYSHVGDYPPGEDELPFVLEDLVRELEMGK